MGYCEECGFYLDSDECEMCDTALSAVGTTTEARNDEGETEARDGRTPIHTWWVTIALTPGLLVVFYALVYTKTPFPYLAYTLTLVFYSVAIMLDLRYIRSETTGWNPRTIVWMLFASLNLLFGGLFTFVLTPYYMYRRQKAEPRDPERT